MRYRVLGRTGLKVSEVGVGGAQFGLRNYTGLWDPLTDDVSSRLDLVQLHERYVS